MSILRKIQEILPDKPKYWAGYLYGLANPVYGRKNFLEWYEFTQKSQWWTKGKLLRYQEKQLKALLSHAYKNIPYYKESFDRSGFDVEKFEGIEDLEKLPILTRDDVINHYSELIAKNIKKKDYSIVHTSGSTGSPLALAKTHESEIIETAFVTRHSSWIKGFNLKGKTIYVRGIPKKAKKLWRYSPTAKTYFFSAYDLTPENVVIYAERMKRIKGIKILRAYPSSGYILARHLLGQGIELTFDGVITSSEKLLPEYRELMEKQFKCKVYDHYGQVETSALIQQCEQSERYHAQMDYGIVEFKERPDLGEGRAELITTGFHNKVMPLLRYNTRDIVILEKNAPKKCECGREGVFIKGIEGRIGDILFLPGGRFVPPVNFYTLFYKFHDSVKQFQLAQIGGKDIEIRIVASERYNEDIEKKIREGLVTRVGNDANLTFKLVSEIERDPQTGKIKNIICNVKHD